MQRRDDTPYGSIANEAGKTEREHIAHEHRSGRLAQRERSPHASCHRRHLARRLLPRRQSHRGCFLRPGRTLSSRCWGSWRRGSRGRREDLAIERDDRAADNLVRQVDSKALLFRREREKVLGDIIGIESGRLRGEARG